MIHEAVITNAIAAIHCVRGNRAFAHILELADDPFILGIEYCESRLVAKIKEAAVEAHQTIVGGWPNRNALDLIAILRVQDQQAPVWFEIPPTGWNVDLFAVQSDG